MGAMLRPGDDRDIKAAAFETEYEEVHNLKNFYKRVFEMLDDEGWKSADGNDDMFETLYFDRTTQDGAQFHHIWWRMVQKPKGNPYYRYYMKVNFQTLYMKKVDIVVKGQKISSFKGSTIMRVESWLQLDYDDIIKNSSPLSIFNLERRFRKRIYFAEVEKAKRDLYLATYRFHTLVKQFMNMKPIIADWGRSFHPERGGVQ